jgi:2-polyprenyl-3-methyl-5-hydroxy-6-metoxy-1,4-benzoquinol methylase
MSHTMTGYIADRSWAGEGRRLSALESALDPNTIRHLLRIGVKEGWRCLEIGAGEGSIAAWMAATVGREGMVVATDSNARPLAELARRFANLTVREEDVSVGVSPCSGDHGFDVAHARLVLGHVRDRQQALRNVIGRLRPGGWLIVEDTDFMWLQSGEQPIFPESRREPYFRVWRAVAQYMYQRGYDLYWGRNVAGALCQAGLCEVGGEAALPIASRPLALAMAMTIERFGDAVVSTGAVTEAELQGCLADLRAPDTVFTGSPTFSVWGRRPERATQ